VFWEKGQTLFPAVKGVTIVGEPMVHENDPFTPEECEENFVDAGLAMQQAPAHLDVLIALKSTKLIHRELYTGHTLSRVTSGFHSPSWHVFEETWTPIHVLFLPQEFTSYPLGALLSMLSSRSAMWLEHCGSHWLAVESYARYPVAQGILCPKTLCSSIFTTRKDWEKHLFL
jgi:hypothetical protein